MEYTEEEKKAIDFFKGRQKYMDNYRGLLEENTDIILNLIEKQQKEIEIQKAEVELKQKVIDELIKNERKNYIPKEAVRKKIEELELYIYEGKNAPQDFLQYRVKAKIQGYKELLGE